jgi:hypothetical protein
MVQMFMQQAQTGSLEQIFFRHIRQLQRRFHASLVFDEKLDSLFVGMRLLQLPCEFAGFIRFRICGGIKAGHRYFLLPGFAKNGSWLFNAGNTSGVTAARLNEVVYGRNKMHVLSKNIT